MIGLEKLKQTITGKLANILCIGKERNSSLTLLISKNSPKKSNPLVSHQKTLNYTSRNIYTLRKPMLLQQQMKERKNGSPIYLGIEAHRNVKVVVSETTSTKTALRMNTNIV